MESLLSNLESIATIISSIATLISIYFAYKAIVVSRKSSKETLKLQKVISISNVKLQNINKFRDSIFNYINAVDIDLLNLDIDIIVNGNFIEADKQLTLLCNKIKTARINLNFNLISYPPSDLINRL